jgi:high-affinity Fe2+/Pb2+ permease
MKGFFGWHAKTEKIRLIAYFAYLIPVMWLFLKKPSTKSVEQSSSDSVSV